MPPKPLGNTTVARILALLFRLVVATRNTLYNSIPWASKKIDYRVISIGSPKAGGTGKTPLALLTGQMLADSGKTIVFLSRGYGRISRVPMAVGPGEEATWDQIGDEPALLRMNLPQAWLGVSANRVSMAQSLQGRIPGDAVMIMDDGFQHRKAARDIDIVTLPPDPFRERMIPVGYLREPLSGLGRATCIVLIGSRDEAGVMNNSREKLRARFPTIPTYTLFRETDGWIDMSSNRRANTPPFSHPGLICGIASPERFVKIVNDQGLNVAKSLICEDHHVFTYEELQAFVTPDMDGILTTEKDALRLSTNSFVNGLNICYLKIRLTFADKSDEPAFRRILWGRP